MKNRPNKIPPCLLTRFEYLDREIHSLPSDDPRKPDRLLEAHTICRCVRDFLELQSVCQAKELLKSHFKSDFSPWVTAYKIFEVKNGELYNLFFSLSGARKVELDATHHAVKKIVSESSAKTKYVSGIHCVEKLSMMKDYLKRFSAERMPRLVVVEVKVREVRHKPTKGSLAWLADQMIVHSGARQWTATEVAKTQFV